MLALKLRLLKRLDRTVGSWLCRRATPASHRRAEGYTGQVERGLPQLPHWQVAVAPPAAASSSGT